jgi:hypothetical protein
MFNQKCFCQLMCFLAVLSSVGVSASGVVPYHQDDNCSFASINATLAADVDSQARVAFEYLLDELALDPTLTKQEQQDKVQEFHEFAVNLSPEVAPLLTSFLLDETHASVIGIFEEAGFDVLEVNERVSEYENAVLEVENMTVEIARRMLFFVEELKVHRQIVYEFGIALGCPEEQLLRHDLSKLSTEQFEAYVRYIRGGRQEVDKQAFLIAWEAHQYEEHHLERYEKEGCSPIGVPDDRLRNNMRETVADVLAATKQRGGTTVIDWLVRALALEKAQGACPEVFGKGKN